MSGPKTTPRILLVMDSKGAPLQACVKAFEELDVSFDVAESLKGIQGKLVETPYNGIVLDVPTVIRSAPGDRAELERVLALYPAYRVMFADGNLAGLCCGRAPAGKSSMESFILDHCASFAPRCIRYTHRVTLVFNVLLTEHENSMTGAERTVTFNISEVGGFVFTTRDWSGKDKAWLVFKELEDRTPVPVTIRRQVEWGQTMDFPGIGVTFDSMTDSQQEELAKHFEHSPKGPSYA